MKLKWLKDKLGEKFYPIAHATGIVVAENKTLDSKLSEIDTEIGNKANSSDLTAHTSDTNNPHNVTAEKTPYDNTESGLSSSNVQDAVDEVSSNLSNIDKLLNVGKNVGMGIDSSTGDLGSSNIYTTSDLILVSPNTKYKYDVTLSSGDYSRIAFYKKDGTFINRQDKIYDFSTPSDCYYLRVMVMTVDYDSGHLYGSDVNNEVNKLNTDVSDINASLDEVNEKVGQNGCGEIAGGKNLFFYNDNVKFEENSNKYQSFTFDSKTDNSVRCYVPNNGSYTGAKLNIYGLKPSTKYSASCSVTENTSEFSPRIYCTESDSDGTLAVNLSLNNGTTMSGSGYYVTFSNIQVEEGEIATDYEPYFPSNKMLAEENAQQSTEMMDIKMLGWSVPRECPVQNEVSGNQFVQKVGRADLGNYDYSRYEQKGFKTKIIGIKNVPDRQTLPNIYCNGYRTVISDATWVYGDISMAPDVAEQVYIMDTSYTDVVTFKSAMKGKYLYYELATPITTTIDGNEIDQRHSTNLTNQQNNGYLQKNLVDYKSLFDNLNDNAEGTTHTYSDGILKISRTANIYSGVYVFSDNIIPLKGKELVVSFDAKSSVSTIKLSVYISTGEVAGTTENLTTDYKRYRLNVKAGSTQDNLIIYGNDVAGDVWIKNFMITEKSVEDTTYVDYIKSNRELDTYKAPKENPVFTGSISMGRKAGTTVGENSTAEGEDITASGADSHAEGYNTTASYECAHAEGVGTTASGLDSHAEGRDTTASGANSHAEGGDTVASGTSSHAEGHVATALDYQHAGGHYNNTNVATYSVSTGTGTGTSFVIGNGTRSARSNAFRVDDNGTPYSKAGLNTTGADYAEFFEWEDGNENNEDRRGYFVTLDGKHIKIAKEGDWILGIVSGFPAIIGNGDEEWKGRYVFDDFGCPVIEEFEYEEEEYETITNSDGKEEVITKNVKKTGTKWKEVPEYDPTQPYTGRMQRKEWAAIGMLGVLSVRDDGSCKVNGFCKLADGGIATASDTGYRVVKRVTDNIVEVIFK